MNNYERQIEFIRWKEEILQRCEEFVDARHAETIKLPKGVKTTAKGNTIVTVGPIEGYGDDGWGVSKNGQKMQVFFGRDAQKDATSYADKLLNGAPLLPAKTDVDKTKSGEGYYDLKQRPSDLFKTPERCVFCGGYYNHREKCPGEPKLGPDQEPSGSK